MWTNIYVLKDPITNRIRYVGKTNDIPNRKHKHIKDAKNGNGKNHRIYWLRSLLERGLRPILEVIDRVLVSEWKEKEQFYIKKYQDEGEDLTNSTLGGDGGDPKYMKKVIQIDPRTGSEIKCHSSIQEAATDLNCNRSAISDCCAGRKRYCQGWSFRYADSPSISGLKDYATYRVAQLDIQTGNITQVFLNCYETRHSFPNFSNIHKVCCGKSKSAYGFSWRFLDTAGNIIQPLITYKRKHVAQLKNNKIVRIFNNAEEAASIFGAKRGDLIHRSCKNKKLTAYGFHWGYTDITSVEDKYESK
jgi:hypothetical protein